MENDYEFNIKKKLGQIIDKIEDAELSFHRNSHSLYNRNAVAYLDEQLLILQTDLDNLKHVLKLIQLC